MLPIIIVIVCKLNEALNINPTNIENIALTKLPYHYKLLLYHKIAHRNFFEQEYKYNSKSRCKKSSSQ